LGTKKSPFFIERNLGSLDCLANAQAAAISDLADCQLFLTWFIYKNGANTMVQAETTPNPEKGFEYQLNITGNSINDIELSIEEAESRIENEFGLDSNDSASFSFNRVGREYFEPDTGLMAAHWFVDNENLIEYIPRDDEYQGMDEDEPVAAELMRLARNGITNEVDIISNVKSATGIKLETVGARNKRFNGETNLYYIA